jgi:hypothetical protein
MPSLSIFKALLPILHADTCYSKKLTIGIQNKMAMMLLKLPEYEKIS